MLHPESLHPKVPLEEKSIDLPIPEDILGAEGMG